MLKFPSEYVLPILSKDFWYNKFRKNYNQIETNPMIRVIVNPTHRKVGLAIVSRTSSIPDVISALGRREYIPARTISKHQINGSTTQLVVALGKVVKHPKLKHDCYFATNKNNEFHYIPADKALVTDTVVAIAQLKGRE